ncbi:MAG: EFR1 family ferrodoxin [Clostridia bacterium]|nr:EFR1 family ferrodoxin [Clostridia bacterium]
MILYFSATGNSKYVAWRLAEATGERTISILDAAGKVHLAPGENLGIVTPVYFLGLPHVVEAQLNGMEIVGGEGAYLYSVATFGTTPGQTGALIESILAKKGLHLSARFSVKMPDSWTPVFDLSNGRKVAKINRAEEGQIREITSRILKKETGDYMRRKLPMFAVRWYHRRYEQARETRHLHVLNRCIGCGRCARDCPMKAIDFSAGHPRWQPEQCAMCLTCLHNCPKFAIQYDDRTEKHGQYRHP